MEESVCKYCDVRIIKRNYGIGNVWLHQHQPGYPEFHEEPYVYCKLQTAMPVTKQDEVVDREVYSKSLTFAKSEEHMLKMLNCQTCNGRYWDVKLGKWMHTRETTMLVCQECGWDYGQEYTLEDKDKK